MTTIFSAILHQAKIFPNKIAVVDSNHAFTYSQWIEIIKKTAQGLHQRGVKPQDRVLFFCRIVIAH